MNITSLEINGNKLNTGKSVLVESYTDPNTHQWYRVYSDGWCEQGGKVNSIPNNESKVVTLQKPYKDTGYVVVASPNFGSWVNHIAIDGQTTTQFKLQNYRSATNEVKSLNAYWIAKGYIS